MKITVQYLPVHVIKKYLTSDLHDVEKFNFSKLY